MNSEFENQEALESAFTEEITGETPDPVEEVEQINQVRVALEHLISIGHTIRQEGVSRHDVRAVKDICGNLQQAGFNVSLGPSLESYGEASFTTSRSMLNERVSTEGIGKAVMDAIKAMIQKLIDYLVKAVRWVRAQLVSDERTERKLTEVLEAAEGLIRAALELLKQTPTPFNKQELLREHAEKLLSNPNLPRSKLTLAAFGGVTEHQAVAILHRDVKQILGGYKAAILTLKDFVDGKTSVYNLNAAGVKSLVANLRLANSVANDLQEVCPDQRFLHRDLMTPTTHVFENGITTRIRDYNKFDFLLKTYEDMGDTLKSIRRVNIDTDDAQAQAEFSEVIAALTEGVDQVGKLVNFFYLANQIKLKVGAQYYNYGLKYFILASAHARECALDERSKEKVQKAQEFFEKKLKGFTL